MTKLVLLVALMLLTACTTDRQLEAASDGASLLSVANTLLWVLP